MTVLDDKLITAGGETKNYKVVKKVLVLNGGQWKDYSEMLDLVRPLLGIILC